ncbi:hypothetical protein [Nocardia cyriacigeorgica]|uniref:hypothetical protein n=1 Tax=Nocardia cyriacigeorgica TaxID=135487 RepID=UPI00201718B5|nr:hypothetical protein [Nocardia cyriacigeorgica]
MSLLLPDVRELLGEPLSKAALYDLEQAVQEEVTEDLMYDWEVDKRSYIDLLRRFDGHRDPSELAAFIGTKPLGE